MINITRMRRLLTIFGLFFVIFVCGSDALAFELSPVKFYLTIKPGTKQIINLQLTNSDAVSKKYDILVTGVKQNERGNPVFADHTDVAEEWVVPDAKNIELAGQSTKNIKFAVSVPFGGQPGGHYVGLIVRENSEAWNDVGVTGELASIVTIQVAGDTRERLEISSWNTAGRLKWNRNWDFDLNLQNSGTIDVPMSGKVRVRSWGEDVVYDYPVTLGSRLLANAARSLDVPINIAEKNIQWPGLYRVEMQSQYGRLGQTLSAVHNVMYVPFWPTLTIALLLLSVLLLVFLLKNRLLKK